MESTVTNSNNSRKKNLRRAIIIVVVLAAAFFGYRKYQDMQRYESTDDAQLETDISPVSSRVAGYIADVRFSENQPVKKGDTLVVIDDRDLRIKVEMAESALENAMASLETAQANASSVVTGGQTSSYKTDELMVRLDQAKKEFDRYQKLLSEGSATPQQFEKAKTEKESLEKQVATARQTQKESDSKSAAAGSQIKVAESVVKQRQTDLDFAKLQLSYAVITAPFDGIVSKKNAVNGQLVQAGQPLCSIVNNHAIWVVANFKETQLRKIKEGMEVNVSVDAYSGKKITGKVASFSSATGSKFSLIPPDNATGNYVKVVQRVPVRIVLNNNDHILDGLIPGMSTSVKVDLHSSGSI